MDGTLAAQPEPGDVEPVDVARIVWRLAARREGVRAFGPSTLPVLGDRSSIETALTELLDTAHGSPYELRIRLAPDGRVRVETAHASVLLRTRPAGSS